MDKTGCHDFGGLVHSCFSKTTPKQVLTHMGKGSRSNRLGNVSLLTLVLLVKHPAVHIILLV